MMVGEMHKHTQRERERERDEVYQKKKCLSSFGGQRNLQKRGKMKSKKRVFAKKNRSDK